MEPPRPSERGRIGSINAIFAGPRTRPPAAPLPPTPTATLCPRLLLAPYYIDTHPAVEAFVKHAGLGFAIPYLYNGQPHDYVPDFLIQLKAQSGVHLILETKGYDPWPRSKPRLYSAGWLPSMPMGSMGAGTMLLLISRKRCGSVLRRP